MSTSFSDELYHHGVKGMKWGVIRTPEQLGHKPKLTKQEKKERKQLTREVAATQRNLKMRGKMLQASQQEVAEAEVAYQKALKRPAIFQSKKRQKVAIATENLKKARERSEDPEAEFVRAARIHDEAKKRLEKNVANLSAKYGEQNIKQLSYKEVQLGKATVDQFFSTYSQYSPQDLVKTGITFANIPIFGTIYTGNVVAAREFEDREVRLRKKVSDRY